MIRWLRSTKSVPPNRRTRISCKTRQRYSTKRFPITDGFHFSKDLTKTANARRRSATTRTGRAIATGDNILNIGSGLYGNRGRSASHTLYFSAILRGHTHTHGARAHSSTVSGVFVFIVIRAYNTEYIVDFFFCVLEFLKKIFFFC